jgi:hypothetical protein
MVLTEQCSAHNSVTHYKLLLKESTTVIVRELINSFLEYTLLTLEKKGILHLMICLCVVSNCFHVGGKIFLAFHTTSSPMPSLHKVIFTMIPHPKYVLADRTFEEVTFFLFRYFYQSISVLSNAFECLFENKIVSRYHTASLKTETG